MSVLSLDIVRQFPWQWNLSVANYAAFQLQKSYSLAGCNVENVHGISQLHQNPRPLPNRSTHHSKAETMKLLQVDCCAIALMSFEISILLLRNVHTLHSTYACCALIHPFPLLYSLYSPTATRMLIYVDYVMKILSLHTKSL